MSIPNPGIQPSYIRILVALSSEPNKRSPDGARVNLIEFSNVSSLEKSVPSSNSSFFIYDLETEASSSDANNRLI